MNTLSQGFNECAFEHVGPVGLQLIEDLLEVIDVLWLRELERVDCLQKGPILCAGSMAVRFGP
jgi:hypothetical protein